MSVLIKGLKMPEKCWDCKLCAFIPIGDDGLMTKCLPLNRATDAEKLRTDCPLVPVPDHGDLIDREKVVKALEYLVSARLDWENAAKVEEIRGLDAAICAVIDAKKVIPAERSEE